MRVAVIRFPGSNCDQDALHALRDDLGVAAEYVWHADTSLTGFDAVYLPGGFSYGDYLRCGAIAAQANIMSEIRRMADSGAPVIGVCNGFQVLCEAGILPGALMPNLGERFVCKDVFLLPGRTRSAWTQGASLPLRIPVAHGGGRYTADAETLQRLQNEGLIAFRYSTPSGELTEGANPNGSDQNIAGIVNERGNVLGLMPHPERATKSLLGNKDGLAILRGFLAVPA